MDEMQVGVDGVRRLRGRLRSIIVDFDHSRVFGSRRTRAASTSFEEVIATVYSALLRSGAHILGLKGRFQVIGKVNEISLG